MPEIVLTRLALDQRQPHVLCFRTNRPLPNGTDVFVRVSEKFKYGWAIRIMDGTKLLREEHIKFFSVPYATRFVTAEIVRLPEDGGMDRLVLTFT